MNKYLVKLGSEMSGGRYFEAVPPVQFQDKEQLPVVVGKNKIVEKNKYLEKIALNKYEKYIRDNPSGQGIKESYVTAMDSLGKIRTKGKTPGILSTAKSMGKKLGDAAGTRRGGKPNLSTPPLQERLHAFKNEKSFERINEFHKASPQFKMGEPVVEKAVKDGSKLKTLGKVGLGVGAAAGAGYLGYKYLTREKQASFSPELLEKLAATALSKRVNDKTKGSRLNVESPMGNHVPSSTLNKSLNSGKVDPLTQPLAQRLADRKQAISLKNGGDSPFKDGKGKADQIHNAKTLRQGGNTGAFDNHPNNFGRANAANIESALKDSKAGHTASLKFNQSGSTSFSSTAPEVKAPQSLGARIMSRLKSGAGSAAAHVRSRVSSMARTPMGKIGLGVGAVAAAGIGAKAMSGPKQEEQPYYSQGYGL